MEDPISLLKEFIRTKQPVFLEDDQLVFGTDLKFSKDTPIKQFTEKRTGKNLTLGQIWFFLKHKNKTITEYLKTCKQEGFAPVSFVDQTAVLSFLIPSGVEFSPEDLDRRPQVTKEEEERPKKKLKLEEHDAKSIYDDVDMSGVDVNGAKQSFHEFLDQMVKAEKVDELKFNLEKYAPFIEFDSDRLQKSLKRKEIPLTTINSITRVKTKQKGTFQNVITLLAEIKKEDKLRKQYEPTPKPEKKIETKPEKKFDEKSVWHTYLGDTAHEELGIDTIGSNLDQMDPVRTEIKEEKKEDLSSKPIIQETKEPKKIRQRNAPIIIIPASLTSPITMYNVKDFLELGEYKPTHVKKAENPKKPSLVVIKRNVDKTVKEYHVIDNPLKLAKEDWNRVVAVVTSGQKWQFKGWQTEKPAELFHKYVGFHIKFDDEELNENVKNWNVKILQISKNDTKRYRDFTIVREFWKGIDASNKF